MHDVENRRLPGYVLDNFVQCRNPFPDARLRTNLHCHIDYQLTFHADALNQQSLVRLKYSVLYPTKSNSVILEIHSNFIFVFSSKVEQIIVPPPE
jgi:hypothetical protein